MKQYIYSCRKKLQNDDEERNHDMKTKHTRYLEKKEQ